MILCELRRVDSFGRHSFKRPQVVGRFQPWVIFLVPGKFVHKKRIQRGDRIFCADKSKRRFRSIRPESPKPVVPMSTRRGFTKTTGRGPFESCKVVFFQNERTMGVTASRVTPGGLDEFFRRGSFRGLSQFFSLPNYFQHNLFGGVPSSPRDSPPPTRQPAPFLSHSTSHFRFGGVRGSVPVASCP